EARKKVLEELRAAGLLRNTKDYTHTIGVHGRCDTVIEPMVSRQWFVKIKPLAEPAIDVVRNGTIQILPQSWDATYFNWMENIRDWPISRQLWWGHRIPAYYCANGHMTVSESDTIVCPQCGSTEIQRDDDVLDTWFSSALWPFSTMGWPENTTDFQTFYPTDVLITGYDILFFWVARMIMMGLRFTGHAPFSQVFLNGIVRDEHGEKMSKMKGNVIDRLNETTREVNKSLSAFRFDEASNTLYHFVWHEFCDWYIEMVKPVLLDKHGTESDKQNAKRVLLEVLDRSLRLLHPFMPFITEEIWQKLGGAEPSIMVAPYPIAEEVLEDREAERMVGAVKAITTAVRNVRAERGFTPKDRLKLYVTTNNGRNANFFSEYG